MPSIGQNNIGGVDVLKDTGSLPTESLDKKNVERGYSGKLSQSRIDETKGNKIQAQHELDQPQVQAALAFIGDDKLKALKEVLSKDKGPIIKSDDLKNTKGKENFGLKSKPVQFKTLENIQQLNGVLGANVDDSTKKELFELVSSLSPDGGVEDPLAGLTETTDETWDKIWESIDSEGDAGSIKDGKTKGVDESIKGGKTQGSDDSLKGEKTQRAEPVRQLTNEEKEQIKDVQKAFNITFGKDGFADTSIKVNSLNGGPKELIDEIKSDFKKITLQFNKGSDLWDTDMLATMLSNIQEKMQTNRLKFDQENIKIGLVQKETLSKKTIGKIRKAIEKVKKAKEAQATAKIFGYIGLAITVLVTVALFATGVGAVVGVLLIAALALQVTMMVDQHTGNHIMKELSGAIQDLTGVDKKEARLIAMAIILAITIALSLGAGAAGGAASGASRFATLASRFGSVVGGAASVGEGASTVVSGVYNYEASILQADSKELKAKSLRLQQLIDDATESLQNALEDLQSGHSRIASIISDNDDTKKQLTKNLKGG